MKKKLFVFSDVHGCFDALRQSLKEAGYKSNDPDHILVSLGDNFDRGAQSANIYKWLKERQCICIRGNHESFLLEALESGIDGEYVLFNFLRNGLDQTIQSFSHTNFNPTVKPADIDNAIKYINRNYPDLKKWIEDMPIVYQTKNYIFVHAGIHPFKRVEQSVLDTDFCLWDIEYSHYPIDMTQKTVVIGHHHAFRVRAKGEAEGYHESDLRLPWTGNIDEHRPVRFGNKIAIDPCSNYTNKVNVLVIEDELLEEAPKVETPTVNFDEFVVDPTMTWATYNVDTTTTVRFR